MTPDVNVVVIDFKKNKGNEMVVPNEDGSYTILINARLYYEGQYKAYQHGMKHIEDNDFQKADIQAIEYEAHDGLTYTETESAERYIERLNRLRKSHRRLKREIEKDKKRVAFIAENCDLFTRAQHQYLYRDDL